MLTATASVQAFILAWVSDSPTPGLLLLSLYPHWSPTLLPELLSPKQICDHITLLISHRGTPHSPSYKTQTLHIRFFIILFQCTSLVSTLTSSLRLPTLIYFSLVPQYTISHHAVSERTSSSFLSCRVLFFLQDPLSLSSPKGRPPQLPYTESSSFSDGLQHHEKHLLQYMPPKTAI